MTAPTAGHGLFDAFPERKTSTPEQYDDVLTNGMITLDANILLNLYRYSAERREELFQFLEQHQVQLFVPHQALKEFWANRQGVLQGVEKEANTTAQELSVLLEQASNKLNMWANRTGLASDKRVDLDELLSAGFREVEVAIQQALPRMTSGHSHDTNDDQILKRLELLLQERVGLPLAPDDHKKAVAEGIRRFDANEPPGFGDKKKKGDARAGDYLVWEQTLIEAEQRGVPVLLVTDDAEKGDWYLVVNGQRRGPLPELVAELHHRAGTQLLMSLTSRLVPTASASPPPNGEGQVGSTPGGSDPGSLVGGEGADEDGGSTVADNALTKEAGWTSVALSELLRRLERSPVQAHAISAALRSDGFVSRESVYKLGGYPETRTLRGFTRPVSGVCQQLRSEGLLPAGAPDALQAVYDSTFSYVQASGFRVPNALLHLAE